jgi:hypothetical protein
MMSLTGNIPVGVLFYGKNSWWQRALLWTLCGTLVLGWVLELAQNWIPARGVTLLDLSADWRGMGMPAFVSKRVFPPG